ACPSLAHQYCGQTKLSHQGRAIASPTVAIRATLGRPLERAYCRRPETNAPPSSPSCLLDDRGRGRFLNLRAACLMPPKVKTSLLGKAAARFSALPCCQQIAT